MWEECPQGHSLPDMVRVTHALRMNFFPERTTISTEICEVFESASPTLLEKTRPFPLARIGPLPCWQCRTALSWRQNRQFWGGRPRWREASDTCRSTVSRIIPELPNTGLLNFPVIRGGIGLHRFGSAAEALVMHINKRDDCQAPVERRLVEHPAAAGDSRITPSVKPDEGFRLL